MKSYKIICLSTAETVDTGNYKFYNLTLERLIKTRSCYRTKYGLHMYLLLPKTKSLKYLTGVEEIIPNHLLEIIEVNDENI